ncbi:MAG: hypothetical protein ACOYL5_18315 [Phototrophicaceae bacterium]|jgi:hypothetical protein
MQPGIPRAAAGALLGFTAGILITLALRVSFGFVPYWNLGLSLVLGVFMSAYGMIWGIGGFNPAMSAHPDDSAPVPTLDEMAAKNPFSVLSNTTWSMAFWVTIMTFGFIALSLIPSVGLTVTRDANSSVKSFGLIDVTLFGETFAISQAVLLLGFIAFTMVSLAIAAGALAWLFTFLNREVTDARKTPNPQLGTAQQNVPALLRRAGNLAGALADGIQPKQADKSTTAVVVKKDQ